MKTRILIALLAALFFAGCAQGGATTEGDFDMNICLENPDDPGCKATTSVDCEKYFWLAQCAGQATDVEGGVEDDGSDSGDDGYVFDEGEGEKAIPAFQVKQSMTIYGKKSQILYIPLEIKAGTGEGPFFWTIDNQGTSATLMAGGTNFRNATIAWYPPTISKTVFTVLVSDKARPDLPPKAIKVTVVINEKIAINARFIGGPLNGVGIGLSNYPTTLNNYTIDELDLRKYQGNLVGLRLFVANLSAAGYEFRSLSNRFFLQSYSCTTAECSIEAWPTNHYSDALGVGFSVTSKATGEVSTLVIKKVLLSNSGEDTQALCSDGKDNDNDGLTDLADDSCKAFRKAETTDYLCSDKKDNDGDEKKDCDDTDCKNTTPCKDPGTISKNIASVSMAILSSEVYDDWHGAGAPYVPLGDAKAIVYFCKDRNCSDKKGPFDIAISGADVTDDFAGMYGVDPAYLNYFKIQLHAPGMPFWLIRSVKVTYYLESDPTLHTAYWNPCVDRILYDTWEHRFGKNDTAICAVTYTSPLEDGADSDDQMQVVIEGAGFEKIKDDTLYDDSINPYLKRKSDSVDYLSLLLDWDYEGVIKSWDMDYMSKDMEAAFVASYGQTVYDCNPFNASTCDQQRKNFDEKKTRPAFQYMSNKKVYMNALGKDGWLFDWYQVFIFQPGYVKSKGSFVTDAILFVMDDKSQWVETDGEAESRKCTPKSSETIWNDKRFGNMADCFYFQGYPGESADEKCRVTLPNPDTTNYCL